MANSPEHTATILGKSENDVIIDRCHGDHSLLERIIDLLVGHLLKVSVDDTV